jgi:hypothetical protein
VSKLQLSRKFVQEAYNAADCNWKARITKEFPKLLQSLSLSELRKYINPISFQIL